MASTVGLVVADVGSLDAGDLRERTLPPVALLIAIASTIGAWAFLPARPFPWQPCVLLACLAILSFAMWLLGRVYPLAAGCILLVAMLVLGCCAEVLMPGSAPLFLLIPLVVAASLAVPTAPLAVGVAAAVCQLGLHLFVHPAAYATLVVPSYVLLGACLSVSAGISHDILRWSWRRHSSALQLSEQLRDRQGQLNSTIKALDLAYRLLQRTNHELAEAREEAEEARHLKEQFAANISHELRTPLNLIVGFSEMMHLSPHVYGDVSWTEPLRRDISQLYRASRHLLQLVDDVLDLSRLNAERVPLHRLPSALGEIVAEAVATVRGLMREQSVAIRLEVEPGLPALSLDPVRIRQTVLNLLNNAIRFTDSGGITVGCRHQRDELVVSVSDTGIGIPEEELERIFDEFYQSARAEGRQGTGMGLGLAIAKRFVQMHGGRIWAESEVGVGSTFYIALPLDGTRPQASRLRSSGPVPPPDNPYADSVLLVGGHGDVARLLERHLGHYAVLSADDQEEAQRLLDEHHPQAVICNLSLAQTRQLTAQLLPRYVPRSVPVIYCAIPCTSWRAELLGVYGSLQKPVGRRELLALLRRLPQARDILVVDDDRRFVQVIMRMLQSGDTQYDVRYAFSGTEALAEMRRQVPDVLLLDLRMPDPDGVSVIASMRADPALREVPTVVITAADMEEQLGGLESGLIGLAKRADWRLGDTIKAMAALLQLARPRYLTASPVEPASVAEPTD
jgi:signal transduction histidine kinase/CheY-like chemotaxis protein